MEEKTDKNNIGRRVGPKYPIGTTFEEYFDDPYENGKFWYKAKVVRCVYHLKKEEPKEKGGGGCRSKKIRMCQIKYEDDEESDLYESEISEYEKKHKIRKLMKPTTDTTNDTAAAAANNNNKNDDTTKNAIIGSPPGVVVVKNENENSENTSRHQKKEETIVPDNNNNNNDGKVSTSTSGGCNNPIIIDDIDDDDDEDEDDFVVPPKKQEDNTQTIIIDDDDDSVVPKPPLPKQENTNKQEDNSLKLESNDVIITTTTEQRNPGLIRDDATPISPERQQQNSTSPTTTAAAADTVPIKEETHKKFKAKRKECYRKYGNRFLLLRQDKNQVKKGIARLGGSQQGTFAYPANYNALIIQDPSYPTPNHLLGESNNDDRSVCCKYDYGYCCYNTTWQVNGPMFAGQETASFDWLPDHFKEPGRPSFPVFMKRTRTKLDSESKGALLGWEYVGNYRSIHDEEVPFWESANNFTKASKKEISSKTFTSSQNENGYGRRRLDGWRDRLIRALEEGDETAEPREEHGLAARCLQLGFRPDMPDKELSELLVNLDEYHKQYMVKFDRYDERIYEYCVGGKINKTKDGKMIKEGSNGTPAKAQDWYDFAEMNRLFKY